MVISENKDLNPLILSGLNISASSSLKMSTPQPIAISTSVKCVLDTSLTDCTLNYHNPVPPPNYTSCVSNNIPGIITGEQPKNPIMSADKVSYSILKELRVKNMNRIILAHININSIRYKFDILTDLVMGKIDILLISETKINETFPSAQFRIFGYSTPYRFNRTEYGGGLLLYIREDIPSKLIDIPNVTKNTDFECLFVEINLHKKKWLIGGTYNPCRSLIAKHLSKLNTCIEKFSRDYDNFIILGDFNSEPSESELQDFCNLYNMKNLVNEPTCYKNYNNPSCIDLIFTNRPKSFQNTTTLETGISDFHKMTITVLKTSYKKKPPKIIVYRDYKKYSQNIFHKELHQELSQKNLYTISNDEFVNTSLKILRKHAPLKQKYLRANQGPFMTKELQKAIMLRSKLRNRLNRLKTDQACIDYKKQRNVCTYILRKAKRDYYSRLDPCKIIDNKIFWKLVKPLFSDKAVTTESITLVEKDDIFQNENIVAEKFNDFFSNAVKSLDIEINNNLLTDNLNETDPILKAIKKYSNHPSILKINEYFVNGRQNHFSFKHTTMETVYNEIMSLNLSKASPKDSIPARIIKENCDIFARKLYIDFNFSISSGTYPNNLKLADITPTYKKGAHTDKENYRPVSILPALSKVYERLLYNQMHDFIESKLSNEQCGFRKGYSAQYCLIVLIEKWRTSIDNKCSAGVLLTDLSKAFDCLVHDLLIAKLNAYGFDYKSLQLIHNYLTNRNQRVRVNSKYSSWSEIINGVPQGSILGPVFFNIYLSDLFLFTSDSEIANYADDNSPYACKNDTESVINQLEKDSQILIEWVTNNALKANPDKFHLLSNSTDENISINVDNFQIFNSQSEKLLGISIDKNLKFDEHVSRLCKRASQKLHALARVSNFMNTEQRGKVMKAFISSQFGYCPLVWMFHSRTLNNRINKIHERALRIVYQDDYSSFDQLLTKDNSFTIHERNIQTLAIELYKIINGLSPEIMKQILPLKESNRYCSRFPFQSRNLHTVTYGTETISSLGPKIWHIIPDSIKNITALDEFKSKIKKWKPDLCPCRLCKTYIDGVGFVNITN